MATFNKGDGDDTVFGNEHTGDIGGRNDTINGNGGDDKLFGRAGNDTIRGGADKDILTGDDGTDTLDGGSGDDELIYDGKGDDTIVGGSGDDDLFFQSVKYTEGSFGEVTGFARREFLVGVVVDVSAATFHFANSSSITHLAVSSTIEDVHLTVGNDRWIDNDAGRTLFASGGDDVIFAFGGDDLLLGGDGDDFLDGGFGDDFLDGGSGSGSASDTDTANFSSWNTRLAKTGEVLRSVIDLQPDPDTVVGATRFESVTNLGRTVTVIERDTLMFMEAVFGSKFTDTILGSRRSEELNGDDGNDTIEGRGGADTLLGGSGVDTVSYAGSGAAVTVNLTTRIHGGGDAQGDALAGFENLTGSRFNDTLTGTSSVNFITGGVGADTLDGMGDADTLRGGAGSDTYTVDNAGDRVDETGGDGTDQVNAFVSYTLALQLGAVEKLTLLGQEDIDATGSGTANTLTGNAGANLLDGGGGGDTLRGGKGDDTYVLRSGTDVVDESVAGSNGIDLVTSSAVGANLSNSSRFFGDIENITFTGSANLVGNGNALDNHIIGNDGTNFLDGRGGVDIVEGGKGDDEFSVDSHDDVVVEHADEGFDTVESTATFSLAGQFIERLALLGTASVNAKGNSLDNDIRGNTGANRITGGKGSDQLFAGEDNKRDVFAYGAAAESRNTVDRFDTIFQFDRKSSPGETAFDRIDLRAIGVTAEKAAFETGEGFTDVLVNTDGDAAFEMRIRVDGVPALTTDDIIFA